MVGTTYLEHLAPAVYLDSWPMEAKVRSKKLEWKLMKISAINRNLDSQPMVGTTYLEHLAPAVYLDSWPMEAKVRSKKLEWKLMKISAINRNLDSQPMVGTTYLECPVLAVYLDSWPMEAKVRSKQREWKPVIFPPDSYTLDSQPMVGTTYLERTNSMKRMKYLPLRDGRLREPEVGWMWRIIRTRTLLRSWSIKHGIMQEHGNSATHEGI